MHTHGYVSVMLSCVGTTEQVEKMHTHVCVVLVVLCCVETIGKCYFSNYVFIVSILSVMRPAVSRPTMCGIKEELRRPSLMKNPMKSG